VKSSKKSFIYLILCSTCGQKSVFGGPQHAAVVDFPAGGSKSFRISQESPTWARELWSNEITHGSCARHHHSPLTWHPARTALLSFKWTFPRARTSPREILLYLSTW